jgi:hypothetical protein
MVYRFRRWVESTILDALATTLEPVMEVTFISSTRLLILLYHCLIDTEANRPIGKFIG